MTQEKVTLEHAVQRLSEASTHNSSRLTDYEQKLTTIRNETAEQNQHINNRLTSELASLQNHLSENLQAIQTQTVAVQNTTMAKLEESQQQWSLLATAIREITSDIKKITATLDNGPNQHESNLTNTMSNINMNINTEDSATFFDQHHTSTQKDAKVSSSTPNGTRIPGEQHSELTSTTFQPIVSTQPVTQTIVIPPASAIPLYHGKYTDNPRQFLIRVKEYGETINHWDSNTLLNGISQFLRDAALDWYCQLCISNSQPQTWTEFTKLFLTQFNSPVRKARQKQERHDCNQQEHETINEFIVRLRTLWSELKPHETENDLIRHLLCKMRSELLQIIGTSRDESLDTIIQEAQKAEEILFERSKGHNESTNRLPTSSRTIKKPNEYFRRNNYSRNTYNYNQQHYPTGYGSENYVSQSYQRRSNGSPCTTCGIYGHTPDQCPGTYYNQSQPNTWNQSAKNFEGARVNPEDPAPM